MTHIYRIAYLAGSWRLMRVCGRMRRIRRSIALCYGKNSKSGSMIFTPAPMPRARGNNDTEATARAGMGC